jgi:antitoxin VapB
MPIQIANPTVVRKVEQLAKLTGLSKTATVEQAVDRLLAETVAPASSADRMAVLLEQIDRIPDRADAFDPLEWDHCSKATISPRPTSPRCDARTPSEAVPQNDEGTEPHLAQPARCRK